MHQTLTLTLTNSSLVFRTPVSERSYRASAFLLDLLLFCQANKFIHSFIHSTQPNLTQPNPTQCNTH